MGRPLVAVYRSFSGEALAIAGRFDDASARPIAAPSGLLVDAQEACIVRLLDAWARFSRELVVEGTVGTTTMGGTRIAACPGVRTHRDVVPELRRRQTNRKAPWWEPRWHSASECLDAVRVLGLANATTIQSALGAANSPAEDLRKVRNFIAHRSEKTAQGMLEVARNIPAPPSVRPAALSATLIPPGITLFRSWVTDLLAIAHAAAS